MEETNPYNLRENQVQFKLFIAVDNHLDIESIYNRIIECTESLSSTYIWNNEAFFLNKPIKCIQECPKEDTVYYTCSGLCDFADNVEDEWFIVYLLNTLSLKYPRKVAAQVGDADGEFLLIHAANFLPAWAQSAGDNCMKNRVFLYNGQLHMIPPASKPSEITYLPASGPIENDLNAVKCVFDFPKLTLALPKIQDCMMSKLSTFETDLNKACFHRTTCIIPAKLAWLLNHNHSLISAAINRFCEKSPDDLKMCRFLNHFKPTDLVSYRVQFTKHLYGKLKYMEYKADKRHEWPSVEMLMTQNLGTTVKFESYSDSTPSKFDTKNLSSLVRERSLLGLKLTCAFEILINNILSSKNSKTFDDYVERLRKLGYFKNYMEHSQKYNELMEKAKESFLLHEQIKNSDNPKKEEPKQSQQPDTSPVNPTLASTKSDTNNYAKLLESIYLDNQPGTECFSKLKTEITNEQTTGSDDRDDWLCVEAPQLDDYLEMYSRGEVSSTYDFSIISNAFKRFLEVPKAEKDLLQGADYNSIEKNVDSSSAELIDFNLDSIEKNLKDLLSSKKPSNKTDKTDEQNINEDDENDSFYEIDEELLEDDLDDNTKLEDNLKSYMSSMDSELKENKNLSRLETKENEDLDLDLNLVSNALESYSSQLGCTGPVSNILKSLGL